MQINRRHFLAACVPVAAAGFSISGCDAAPIRRGPNKLPRPGLPALPTATGISHANTHPGRMNTAGRAAGVRCFAIGREHAALTMAAMRHAEYMARAGVQGHQNFNRRYHEILDELHAQGVNANSLAEVAAESWPHNDAEGLAAVAAEMFNSWRQSPGHWACINDPGCKWYGFGMARGSNGIWYGAGLIAH